MRLRLLGVLAVIGLLGSALLLAQQQNPSTPPPAPPPPPQEPLKKSETKITPTVNLVDVLFTVLDRRNKLVPALEKQDFKVFDDNAAQDIRYLSRQSDLPLPIGMLF